MIGSFSHITWDAFTHQSGVVVGAMLGGLFLIGVVGAVQGAKHGDVYDVVKGGAVGALAGSMLSLLLSCAALTRWRSTGIRPG